MFNKIPYDPNLTVHEWVDAVDYPGLRPYTGGPYASMYLGQPWTIRQYAGFSTASESNQFYKDNLKAGQKGLSVAFDLPTHRGYDSDHPRVKADVGKAGVAIDTVHDMQVLFDGIPLDQMSVSMTMNGAVIPIMAFYIVAAEMQGVSPIKLSGTIQNDILKEFLVRNTYIYPPQPSMRLVTDIFKYCSRHMPKFNAISVSGYHMLEAGALPHLELAFTLADGYEYLMYAKNAGIEIDTIAPRISFFFGIGMDFWKEIAKLRAARILWEKLVTQIGAISDKSKLLRMHCQTSGWSLVSKDIDNNVARTAIEAMAAVLGGTQSLHTNSKDEAISLPTKETAAIARNTQLYLQQKSGLTHWTDLLSGSEYVASLTAQLMKESESILNEILDMGGMTKAIESGYPKRKIEESAALRQADIDAGTEKIVGTNYFIEDEKNESMVLKIDHTKVLNEQIENINTLKKNRDGVKVSAALEQIKNACKQENLNILEAAIEAAKAEATLGEISDAIENVYGRYHATVSSSINIYGPKSMDKTIYKKALQKVIDFEKKHGRRPRMLISKLGQDGHDRGAKIIAAGFADLGFDIDMGPLFQTPAEAAKHAMENDVHFIGASSLAGGHMVLLDELMHELKKEGREDIRVIAGGIIPKEDHQKLYDMGVFLIFGPGTNLSEAAISILK